MNQEINFQEWIISRVLHPKICLDEIQILCQEKELGLWVKFKPACASRRHIEISEFKLVTTKLNVIHFIGDNLYSTCLDSTLGS